MALVILTNWLHWNQEEESPVRDGCVTGEST